MFRSDVALIVVTLFFVLDQVSCQLQFDWILGPGADEQTAKKHDAKNKIKFLLFNPKNGSLVEWKNGSIPKGLWQKQLPLKLLVHGYSKETLKTSNEVLASQKIHNIAYAYGNGTNKVNVVAVDWTALALDNEIHYKHVVESVPIAGKVVAEFILKLVKSKHLENVQNVHLIGYGVGAHVTGVAGKEIHENNKKGGGKVGRITGLDPAGVGFDDETGQKAKNKSVSLGRNDAEFVDVIHCNLGMSKTYQDAKWKGRYGSAVQAGHIDFYPNGGMEQNGCNKVADIIAKECHSQMCVGYFINSIEGQEYVGCPCVNFDDFEDGNCNCTLNNGGRLMGEPSKKEDESKAKHYLEIEGLGKTKKRVKPAKKKDNGDSKNEKKAEKTKGTKAPEKKLNDDKEKKPVVPEKVDEKKVEELDNEPASGSKELQEPENTSRVPEREVEDASEEVQKTDSAEAEDEKSGIIFSFLR